ncbi:LysR family transcriptional regulator [Aurantivibrio plasticivorans]
MKTTIEQWRMLEALIKHGSFAKAASAIHKSQSSINTAVHKLQDSLGVTLVTTQGKRTTLTTAGELLLRRGSLVLDEVKRIEELAQQLGNEVETHFPVAVDSIFPYEVIYRAFDELSIHYPFTRVELRETILSGSNELFASGEVTVAISASAPPGILPEQIAEVEFVAVASPHHPLTAKPAPLSPQDLQAFRQIVTRDSGQHHNKDSGWLEAEQRWTVTNLDTSIDLIKRGFGYAWLPRTKIDEAIRLGELVELPLQAGTTRHQTLYLVTPDEASLGPVARCFITTLRRMRDE